MWEVTCDVCGLIGVYQNLKSQTTAVKHMAYKNHVVHRYPWNSTPDHESAKTYTPDTLNFDPDTPPF